MSSSVIKAAVILVVDDNPATRYSTARVLRGAGWTVREAETGGEAIQLALTGVDLLVLDIDLPDIDGYEVCRRLRENDATARLPILHLSATFVTADHKVTGLESGADGYLTHPIEPPVLIATVNAFLRTRQAEIELRASEARFKAIFENALTGVVLLDDHWQLVDVNPMMCRILGGDRSGIIGSSFLDFVPAEVQPLLETIQSDLRQTLAWHGCLPLQTADQQTVQLEWHISRHNEPGLYLAIANDITDRLRFEAERESLLSSERAARTDAERANSLKDEFLATLSHELRTPLSAIVGWAHLLQLGKLSATEVIDGLTAVGRNARALTQMISDLLDVSRITSGKLRLDIEPLDPADVIDTALTAILPMADAKSVRVTKALQPQTGPISGDSSRLQQVLWNLVNNAVKFTPQGGHVHVTLSRLDSQIEIQVSDSGQGISEELLPRIFDRFRQGDSSSTREHGGLGLGLAIAKQLVELHGGQISAESAGPGQGATFKIMLPVMASQAEEQRIPPAPEPDVEEDPTPPAKWADLTGLRILLVEDDPDSRQVIKRIINESGADVCDVSNYEDALAAIPVYSPEIVVSDLGMPGHDGYELMQEVRRRGYTFQALPAVALTAFAHPEDRRRALMAGFQFHLTKPVDPAELLGVIASLTGKAE